MVRKLSPERRYQLRMNGRTYDHGKGWRQVFVDCGGMCVGRLEDGMTCCESDGLEFHEPFGEDLHGWGKFQARVLMCPSCHDREPGTQCVGNPEDSRRHINTSMLAEDIDREVEQSGSWDAWIKKFNLVDKFAYLHTT